MYFGTAGHCVVLIATVPKEKLYCQSLAPIDVKDATYFIMWTMYDRIRAHFSPI